ncbi:unnamed protein product [Brassica rapa subsp. trilocularis]
MGNVRFPFLVYLALCLVISVLSQDQSDDTTGINYVSDSSFVETGVSKPVSFPAQRQLQNLMSFPEGSRNCYTLIPKQGKGKKYLIRASFMYGNYDGEVSSPEFDLFLGGNLWTNLSFNNTPLPVTKEVVYLSQSEKIFVCLGNKGKGTPFISTLELRFLGNDNTTYDSPNGALSDSSIRYSEDVYDRIWLPRKLGAENKEINTSLPVTSSNNSYNPPGLLMSTALTPTNTTAPISMELADTDPTVRYFVYMHFAEVEDLSLTPNQTREFEIYINQVKIAHVSPRYLQTDTFFLKPESQTNIKFLLVRTPTSTLPPLINALEIYVGNTYSQSFTSQDDDDAVTSIKMSYKVKRNWQGDPCLPNSYIWEGLNCSYASLAPPRITLLNLSSSGLTGHLSPSFSNLTMIQELDLSNNDLTGEIPESLSGLKFLRVLNLEKNKLTGSVPSDLLKRSKSGSLLLKVGDNPGLCTEVSCVKSNKKTLITAVGASLAALFILLLLSGVFWKIKKRSNKPVEEDTDNETRNRPKADSNTLLLTFSDISHRGMEFSREAGMMMENKRSVCSLEESSIKRHKSDLSFSSKRKDKAGDRISALQQIVSPYGKTDTASVLQDALHYIEFLHEQVKVLSAPYLQTMTAATQEELEQYSLRNRGLCLVPMEYTAGVAQSNGADIWAPVKTPPSPAFGVKSQSPFR